MTTLVGRKPRFTPADVEAMADLRAQGWSYDRIAYRFGTARSVVSRYLRGECRHHQKTRAA